LHARPTAAAQSFFTLADPDVLADVVEDRRTV
jgi:hypothetical protein